MRGLAAFLTFFVVTAVLTKVAVRVSTTLFAITTTTATATPRTVIMVTTLFTLTVTAYLAARTVVIIVYTLGIYAAFTPGAFVVTVLTIIPTGNTNFTARAVSVVAALLTLTTTTIIILTPASPYALFYFFIPIVAIILTR
jgi:hypothetical protein